MAADDPFDTVSGGIGLTGGVDTIAILKRGGVGVTLYIQGRDLVEDIEKAVRLSARAVAGRFWAKQRKSIDRANVLA